MIMLYSMLKGFNVSFSTILQGPYSHTKSDNGYFASDLQNKWKETRCGQKYKSIFNDEYISLFLIMLKYF